MRTGARLRVSLEPKHRTLLEGKALERAIEERAVRGHHSLRQGALVHRKAVVLTGDEHAPGLELLHRMIRAVVTELHFHGACTGGESEDLVPETDPEHREIGFEKASGGRDR